MTTLDLINGEERALIRDNDRFPFARDLDLKVRRIGQRPVVAEGELGARPGATTRTDISRAVAMPSRGTTPPGSVFFLIRADSLGLGDARSQRDYPHL